MERGRGGGGRRGSRRGGREWGWVGGGNESEMSSGWHAMLLAVKATLNRRSVEEC